MFFNNIFLEKNTDYIFVNCILYSFPLFVIFWLSLLYDGSLFSSMCFTLKEAYVIQPFLPLLFLSRFQLEVDVVHILTLWMFRESQGFYFLVK